jgi:SsrA-binding protein
MLILAKNKRALFDYEILEKYEAGLVLEGHEVKSIKTGHISVNGSFVVMKNGECWLIGATVSPYKMAGRLLGYDPARSRKLLLHRHEIDSLIGKTKQKGLTLVPLEVYTKGGKIKLKFGLARGKKKYEKRETIRKREVEKKIREEMKRR